MLNSAQKRVGDGGGKRSEGKGKGQKKVNRESIHLGGQHVTEFLTLFAYEWYCMAMCTCIILIVNLPTEYERIHHFILGREDKQMKQHYYVTFSEIRLINLYNMTRPAKDCRVKFACTIVNHTLDVY